MFLAKEPAVSEALSVQAHAGARMRICLHNPEHVPAEKMFDESRAALALFTGLRQIGADIRLHRAILCNSIYRSDKQLLVMQHLYGIPRERASRAMPQNRWFRSLSNSQVTG